MTELNDVVHGQQPPLSQASAVSHLAAVSPTVDGYRDSSLSRQVMGHKYWNRAVNLVTTRTVSRLLAVATFGWFGVAWIHTMALGRLYRYDVWLLDWNVYHAAAQDLMARTLYRVPLPEGLPTFGAFNYPPLAALEAVPFLPLGREPGGIAWLAVCGVSVALAGLLTARSLGVPAFLVGVVLLLWSRGDTFLADVLLANDNHLMLGLVAGFVWAHLAGKERLAGVLLALAIGTKVWPVALLVLVLRERRWSELRWTMGTLAVQAVIFLAWLGPDVIGPMIPAVLGDNAPRNNLGTVPVLWTTWARVALDWWPAWGGYAVAALLLLFPAKGRLGLGVGIMAGLALNTNLWHHYGLTVLLGLGLVAVGLLKLLDPHAHDHQVPAPARISTKPEGRVAGFPDSQQADV